MELQINSVSKQYRNGHWGLRDVNLSLKPGVIGLLGPNGAGKSTLMRILATTARPTSGTVLWNGIDTADDPNALRKVLGYLPQDFGVYPNLTPQEFLEYIAAAKGIVGRPAKERIENLLELVNLTTARKRALGGFSGGMKQRVGIASALLNDPKLLIVDEPTAGLDPEERVRFRNLLSELSGDRIIILSTHIVSDVEAVANDIALIREGTLLGFSSSDAWLNALDGKVWEMVVPADQVAELKTRFTVSGTARRNEGVRVRIVAPNAPSTSAQVVLPTLEDAYLYFIRTIAKQAA